MRVKSSLAVWALDTNLGAEVSLVCWHMGLIRTEEGRGAAGGHGAGRMKVACWWPHLRREPCVQPSAPILAAWLAVRTFSAGFMESPQMSLQSAPM